MASRTTSYGRASMKITMGPPSKSIERRIATFRSRRPGALDLLFLSLMSLLLIPSVSAWMSAVSQRPSKTHDPSILSLAGTSSKFLDQVWETIDHVLDPSSSWNTTGPNSPSSVLDLPTQQRESYGVAMRLSKRLSALKRNNDCPACWLQRAHCICSQTPPIDRALLPPGLQRVFLILHHKEVGLLVDTAKLLLNSMPDHARLVVAGVDEDYQASMSELQEAIQQTKRPCFVLFPTDDARTFPELIRTPPKRDKSTDCSITMDEYDLIVLDGTWQQARRIHQRYIPAEADGGPPRVCLSDQALEKLGGSSKSTTEETSIDTTIVSKTDESQRLGRQLRRHPIPWKEVSTLEATRLLFQDILVAAYGKEGTEEQSTDATSTTIGEAEVSTTNTRIPCNDDGATCYDLLQQYQVISDAAVRKQLGPPRKRQTVL